MLGVSDLANVMKNMTMYSLDDNESLGSLDSMESFDSSKLRKHKGKRKRKFLLFPEWERAVDDNKNVYYIHTPSGETEWLPPCCRCGEYSTKFCIGCAASYCDKDWEYVHTKPDRPADSERIRKKKEEFRQHKTATTEPYSANFLKERLGPNEVHCIECNLKRATKMCTECWDSYCTECFKNVHHIGALQYHRVVPYSRAVLGWVRVRKFGAEPDLYVNGTTGEKTQERPEEFLSELETSYRDGIVLFEAKKAENLITIKKLEAELQQVKADRDAEVLANFKS